MVSALAIGAACGSARDRTATAIADQLSRELGVPTVVSCDRDRCVATTAIGLRIPITLTGDAAGTWHTAPLFEPAPIAAEVHARLQALGVDQPVDCGPLRLADDAPIRCQLGAGGLALATIADDGTVEIELALTAAIANARTVDYDPTDLEARSLALDTDEAEGADPADDDERDDGADAGVTPPLRGPGG